MLMLVDEGRTVEGDASGSVVTEVGEGGDASVRAFRTY